MDSPWDEDVSFTSGAEWSKIEADFTNTGYREGITAGKESALQEGFDDGFAHVGAPLGRKLGVLRGIASAILSHMNLHCSDRADSEHLWLEAREITSRLASVRLADVAPRDIEAEQHAREHLETEGIEMEMNEEVEEKKNMEGLEDMLAKLTAGADSGKQELERLSIDDVRLLEDRLGHLVENIGFNGGDNLLMTVE